MTDQQLEKDLIALGKATEPHVSLVDGVMRRIEQSAAPRMTRATGHWPSFRGAYRVAAIVAVGACIAAVIFSVRGNRGSLHPPQIVIVPRTNPINQNVELFPTLADYQRAYIQSPDALESLLQQRPLEPNARVQRVARAGDVSLFDLNL